MIRPKAADDLLWQEFADSIPEDSYLQAFKSKRFALWITAEMQKDIDPDPMYYIESLGKLSCQMDNDRYLAGQKVVKLEMELKSVEAKLAIVTVQRDRLTDAMYGVEQALKKASKGEDQMKSKPRIVTVTCATCGGECDFPFSKAEGLGTCRCCRQIAVERATDAEVARLDAEREEGE